MLARSSLADDFDGMLCFGIAEGLELLAARVLIGKEALCKLAVLDFGEDLLHRLAAFGVDDPRPADVVAPLGGVGDGVAHVRETAAIDQVDDQLELVEHFEVGALGLIAGFDQCLVTRLDQRADAAAEHGLLAEEIGLGFFLECGLENSGACAADALEIAERQRVRVAGRVLMDGDEPGDTAALSEDLADAMSGSLGRGHTHVDVCGGNDGLEVNVESMGEEQQLARVESWERFLRRRAWPASDLGQGS